MPVSLSDLALTASFTREPIFSSPILREAWTRTFKLDPHSPWAFSSIFRSSPDSSSHWLVPGSVDQNLLLQDWEKYGQYQVEGNRYSLLHQLTGSRLKSMEDFHRLIKIEEELRANLPELASRKSEGLPPAIDWTKKLQEARALLDGLESELKLLEKWALQDGKDKALSREGALDMAFNLLRAQEILSKSSTDSKVNRSFALLRDTQARRFQAPENAVGLNFGLAAIDLNVTAPNSVNRELGDIVLEQTYQILKSNFPDSVVSKGTRTNFRVVNPDGSKLNQENLLKLESAIAEAIKKKVEQSGNSKWIEFIRDYQVNLSAGYAEVNFDPAEVILGPHGEYQKSSVQELLVKVDNAFRLAHARSQEVVGRLKQARSLTEATQVSRMNHGQFPIEDMNGIPEGRFFEPKETPETGWAPIRLVHSLKNLSEQVKGLRDHLDGIERYHDNPQAEPNALEGLDLLSTAAVKVLREAQKEFRTIHFDVTHDQRMPRLIERTFAPERVDAIVRETGGARLLFIELGKFKSFANTWYGGNQDQYVHNLIYEFYKVLSKKGMTFLHPANQAKYANSQGEYLLDPKSGEFFSGAASATPEPVRFLIHPSLIEPIASETSLGMRDGDEIGFLIGERNDKGKTIDDRQVKEVFRLWQEGMQDKFGMMFFDDIEKVGPEKVRTPKWQVLEYKQPKDPASGLGKHEIVQSDILKLESEMTEGFNGLVLDYDAVTREHLDPTVGKDVANVVVGRRQRWRYFENGKPSTVIPSHFGDPILINEGSGLSNPTGLPAELVQQYPQLLQKPILVKMQTALSAGYVSMKLNKGSELQEGWNAANDLSKKSKLKGGLPVFAKMPKADVPKPEGHDYDRSISSVRSEELSRHFTPYMNGYPTVDPALGMSAELLGFLRKHGNALIALVNPNSPQEFPKELQNYLLRHVKESRSRDKLSAEIKAQFEKGGSLAQVRDGMLAVQILEKEGIHLQLKSLSPAFWRSIDLAQQMLGRGDVANHLGRTKALLVKLYVQQTGDLPPTDILEESKKYLDPKSVFIPQEIYSLARQYHIPPEKVPYFVAGLNAAKIRELGQQAFRSLTFEDLHKLAESPEGQAFLRDPQNSLLLKDSLKSRVAYQGAPLLTAMLSIFPAEMVSSYVAKKIGGELGWSPRGIQEFQFGLTLYTAHTINITASGMWEVTINRVAASRALSKLIGTEVSLGTMHTAKFAGQELVRIGIAGEGNILKALGDGVLEKWGIRALGESGVSGVAWHIAKGIPRVPLNMLKTMGAGYLSATIFDRFSGIWLQPDNPVRKYGSFLAFFAPDILRLTLGSTRIAASPFLTRAGGLFNRVGNGVLAVAIANFLFKKIAIDNDYESSVQKRVTDRVFEQNVYRWNSNDKFILPLGLRITRATFRELAPDAMNWAVNNDNPAITEQVLSEDRDQCQKVREFLAMGIPRALANPTFFNSQEASSYQKIDYSFLTKAVELDATEKRVLNMLNKVDGEIPDDQLSFIPPDKKEEVLQRVTLYQMQEGIKYLLAVQQSGNKWARELFNPDGTLKEGRGDDLVKTLLPSKAGEPDGQAKILSARQVWVATALVDGQVKLNGQPIEQIAQKAGLMDANKNIEITDSFLSALTLYANQAYLSKDETRIRKVVDWIGDLQMKYLSASATEQKKYLDALKCLGVENKI